MFKNNYIIVHNTNNQWHMSLGHMYAQHMKGWLSPYNAITTYQTSWPLNKAILARRTKCHIPPYPNNYENYKLLLNYLIHMWAVPRVSHLLLGGSEYTQLLFLKTFLHYCINACSKLLPNKCMELNKN